MTADNDGSVDRASNSGSLRDPVAYELDRIWTMLHWIEEHHSSYEIAKLTSPETAEQEWDHLTDAIRQAVKHFDSLTTLLTEGKNLDLTKPLSPSLVHHQRWIERRKQIWTWSQAECANVLPLFDRPLSADWCDQLERSAGDGVTGKVLCVCVAYEIARAVTFAAFERPDHVFDCLALLGDWIDNPQDESFENIKRLVFEESAKLDSQPAVWWALRSATTAVGCREAAWALQGACDVAAHVLTPYQIQLIAKRAVVRRCSL